MSSGEVRRPICRPLNRSPSQTFSIGIPEYVHRRDPSRFNNPCDHRRLPSERERERERERGGERERERERGREFDREIGRLSARWRATTRERERDREREREREEMERDENISMHEKVR